MEEHFLKEFVSGVTRETPIPWYNRAGDCIQYQVTDEATIAQRIDEILTMYVSAENQKIVGFKIKGVGAIVRKFGWEGVALEFEGCKDSVTKISLYALLLAAYETGPKTIGRRVAYANAFESFPKRAEIQFLEPELAVA